MKVVQLASPFGVFLTGVALLAIGYFMYVLGLSRGDVSLIDSALPIQNLGLTLMGSGVVLYVVSWLGNLVFHGD